MRSPSHPVALQYLELVASVERCVRSDFDESKKLRPIDPMPIMEWLRGLEDAMYAPLKEQGRDQPARIGSNTPG